MAKKAEVEQLWRRFHDRLRRFIERRVDSREDAEDIVQEVFVRIPATTTIIRAKSVVYS